MLTSLPRNAVTAKARAMYGKRLTDADYSALLSCGTVAQAVSYLKSETRYDSVLASETPSLIRIGRFKELLHKHYYRLCEEFCRYEKALNQPFYMYFVYRNDALLLLQCVNALYDTADFWQPVLESDMLTRCSELDVKALGAASDYGQLLSAVKGTDYYDYLVPFRTDFYSSAGTYVMLEDAVYTCLNKKIRALCEKCFTGKERDEVLDAIALGNDMLTVSTLVRLKSFPVLADAAKYMNSFGELTAFSPRELKALRNSAGAEELQAVLSHTKYRTGLSLGGSDVEDFTARLMYNRFSRQLRFSRNQTVVLLCYLYLAESEITDIMRIVEGIRYSASAEETKQFLIHHKEVNG